MDINYVKRKVSKAYRHSWFLGADLRKQRDKFLCQARLDTDQPNRERIITTVFT